MAASTIQMALVSSSAACNTKVSLRKASSVQSKGFRFGSSRISVPQKRSIGIVCEAKETVKPGLAAVVTDNTFKSLVLENSGTVLVDFWAPWCGPCRMIAPVIDTIAKEYEGKLTCLKLNTDESPAVATEYGIRSIPTVMIFKGGKKLETIIGAVPKDTLVGAIVKCL